MAFIIVLVFIDFMPEKSTLPRVKAGGQMSKERLPGHFKKNKIKQRPCPQKKKKLRKSKNNLKNKQNEPKGYHRTQGSN